MAFISTPHNASKRGGGIYHEDTTTSTQCNFEPAKQESEDSLEVLITGRYLPYCFLKSSQTNNCYIIFTLKLNFTRIMIQLRKVAY